MSIYNPNYINHLPLSQPLLPIGGPWVSSYSSWLLASLLSMLSIPRFLYCSGLKPYFILFNLTAYVCNWYPERKWIFCTVIHISYTVLVCGWEVYIDHSNVNYTCEKIVDHFNHNWQIKNISRLLFCTLKPPSKLFLCAYDRVLILCFLCFLLSL